MYILILCYRRHTRMNCLSDSVGFSRMDGDSWLNDGRTCSLSHSSVQMSFSRTHMFFITQFGVNELQPDAHVLYQTVRCE